MKRSGPVRRVRVVVAAGVVAVAFGAPAAAMAQSTYTGTPAPDAGSADRFVPARAASDVAGSSLRAQSSSGLALTGTDVAEVGLVGLGAIATGAVLVRRARRTT